MTTSSFFIMGPRLPTPGASKEETEDKQGRLVKLEKNRDADEGLFFLLSDLFCGFRLEMIYTGVILTKNYNDKATT